MVSFEDIHLEGSPIPAQLPFLRISFTLGSKLPLKNDPLGNDPLGNDYLGNDYLGNGLLGTAPLGMTPLITIPRKPSLEPINE